MQVGNDEIIWQDPPRSGAGIRSAMATDFVAILRQNPGKWAIKRTARYADAEMQRTLKKLGCEAVNRSNGDGTYTLYARWPEGGAS